MCKQSFESGNPYIESPDLVTSHEGSAYKGLNFSCRVKKKKERRGRLYGLAFHPLFFQQR